MDSMTVNTTKSLSVRNRAWVGWMKVGAGVVDDRTVEGKRGPYDQKELEDIARRLGVDGDCG